MKKVTSVVFICFFVFIFSSFVYGKETRTDRSDKEEKASGHILYKVSLEKETERSKIYNYSKKRFKFKTDVFKDLVKKYHVFLVLNDQLDAVLAEIVVVKMKRSKQIAYAKSSRMADGVKQIDLVGKTVIRLDDLGHVMGSVNTYRRNPLFEIDIFGTSSIMSSANVATGIELTPQVLSTGLQAQIFIPASSGSEWMNWFGVRYKFAKILDSELTLRTAKNNREQKVIFSGDRKNLEVVFQPWFSEWWLYHVSFIYGLSQKKQDVISFENTQDSATEEYDSVMTVDQDASYLGLGIAFNPVHNLYGGIRVMELSSQDFTVKESTSEESKIGKWSERKMGAWFSWIHAIDYELKLSMRFNIDLRQDQISESYNIGSGRNHSITDWERSVLFGVHYAP